MLKKDLERELYSSRRRVEYLETQLPAVELSTFAEMGRGLAASRDIKQNEIFLECPVVPLSPGDQEFIKKTILQYYIFDGSLEMTPFSYIAMGLGSFINHSVRNNAEFEVDEFRKVIYFKAIEDIEAGSQILIDYNWD